MTIVLEDAERHLSQPSREHLGTETSSRPDTRTGTPFHYHPHNGYRGRTRGKEGRGGTQTENMSRLDPVNADTKDEDKIPPGVNKAGDLTCHKCGKPEHFRINCPRKGGQPVRIQHRRKAPENLLIMSNSDSSDDELSETG